MWYSQVLLGNVFSLSGKSVLSWRLTEVLHGVYLFLPGKEQGVFLEGRCCGSECFEHWVMPLDDGVYFLSLVRSSSMCLPTLNVSSGPGAHAVPISFLMYCTQLCAEAWAHFYGVQDLWPCCLSLLWSPEHLLLTYGMLARLSQYIWVLSLLKLVQGQVEEKQLMPCFLKVPTLHLLTEQKQQPRFVVWWYVDVVIVLWETNSN